jgi:tRNA (guanine37-N1)-methyltransferase
MLRGQKKQHKRGFLERKKQKQRKGMRLDILSLFPEYFQGPFDASIVKRAKEKKIIDIHLINIRDFTTDKHKRVDSRPYGGGPGMVLKPEPVCEAIRSVKKKGSLVVYLSPQGKTLTAKKCMELSLQNHIILLCGHYEGIDERVIDIEVDEEISIGDYVLTNGCIAAIVLVDAVIRFIPGVLGNEEAAMQDSFQNKIFDAPHYTRPEIFEGRGVPDVLKNGHHKKILQWRCKKATAKTKQIRPELMVTEEIEGSEDEKN